MIVIGAAGLLGREIVVALRTSGLEVLAVGRQPRPGWLRFNAELDPPELLLRNGADFVVNAAGVLASEIDPGDPDSVGRAEAINARFPHELAAAAADAGARLIHVSTDGVFREDAGRCFEDDDRFADDLYGSTKRRGEPATDNALTLRCSFVGRDPERRRGLLEWLLAEPGGDVPGFVDQAWNGLASTQVAAVCAALAEPELFERTRAEGQVHHVFEDPPLTKHELVVLLVQAFRLHISVVPSESGRPSTRTLGTRYAVLSEYLESVSPRAASLEAMAGRGLT